MARVRVIDAIDIRVNWQRSAFNAAASESPSGRTAAAQRRDLAFGCFALESATITTFPASSEHGLFAA